MSRWAQALVCCTYQNNPVQGMGIASRAQDVRESGAKTWKSLRQTNAYALPCRLRQTNAYDLP